MKLKGFDVDLFNIPNREFGAVRIARNRDFTYGAIKDHEYQFIIIQLLTEQTKMRELLEAVNKGNHNYGLMLDEKISLAKRVHEYLDSIPK